MIEDEAELEHGKQEEHEDWDEDRELHEPLAALGVASAGHRIGSMRMEFDWVSVKPGPPWPPNPFAPKPPRGVTHWCW